MLIQKVDVPFTSRTLLLVCKIYLNRYDLSSESAASFDSPCSLVGVEPLLFSIVSHSCTRRLLVP